MAEAGSNNAGQSSFPSASKAPADATLADLGPDDASGALVDPRFARQPLNLQLLPGDAAPQTTLLSLPTELLAKIGWSLAPLGGKESGEPLPR